MYQKIQAEVKRVEGFTVKSCWIADVKEREGLPMRKAPNRKGLDRLNPCPPEKRGAIESAMRRLRLL
jgi:hypothetical protein